MSTMSPKGLQILMEVPKLVEVRQSSASGFGLTLVAILVVAGDSERVANTSDLKTTPLLDFGSIALTMGCRSPSDDMRSCDEGETDVGSSMVTEPN